jgi:hypothetical protein
VIHIQDELELEVVDEGMSKAQRKKKVRRQKDPEADAGMDPEADAGMDPVANEATSSFNENGLI